MNISRYSRYGKIVVSFALWLLVYSASHGIMFQAPDTILPAKVDTPIFIKPTFLRLGIDVSSFARSMVEREVRQFEISLDTEILRNGFLIFETGYVDVGTTQEGFSYNASGFFGRLGMDYNFLENTTNTKYNNLVTVGMRYSYGFTSHESPYYLIRNPYWGDYEGALGASGFSVHWLEFAAGLKTEVLRNLYLGWNIKARMRLWSSKDAQLTPYYLPGFGHSKRRAPVMLHYSVYYKIGR